MSEQTPESTANITDEDGFAVAESEPSMEDILASIRKIISDDADPVPLDGPGDAPIENSGEELSPVSNATAEPLIAVDAEADPFDLDSLLGDLNAGETSVSQNDTFAQSIGIGDMASLDDDLAIPELDVETDASEAASLDQDQDDMDRLMNELLVDMDEPTMMAGTEGPLAAAVVPHTLTPQVGKSQTATDDDDMDVVKSLIADLTDDDVDPSADASSLDDLDLDLDAMMNELAGFDTDPISETQAESVMVTESDMDDLDLMEDDIFESILEMTLEDEVEAFDAKSEIDPNVPSLADIAAAAEAEAIVEPAVMVKSAAVLGAKTQQADIEEPVSGASVTPEPAKPTPSEMETPMPSALRSDAILDDVTEKASMSAFAELNQVVEDKAILSERGPRIGDLVQDALKPMLKEWLDANIQSIVERAVAKEVKRIADGK
ncbi:hypothetical protein GCM10009069_26580 [Algimonas arctica]|uniref:DUF2497 domain-containing protein n=1 Tax=Algimonas arctica TaxID=1479486 RepID=A0A8J3CUE0_9PROT|nr:DUF2497 domain-containing protein [Algimonas arctica]GHB02517.1 hypothetical protein GCM10009069_26580 [Algimonas arctica]